MMATNRSSLAVLALLLSLSVLAADAPQIPQQASIRSSGEGPYFQLSLPVTIYPTAMHADLRDVRIRNSSGQLLPHAWLNSEGTEVQTLSAPAAFYPIVLRGGATSTTGSGQADVSLEFKQGADGSLLTLKTRPMPNAQEGPGKSDWIIDASQIKGNLLQANFGVDDTVEGVFPLSIEGSDDLRHWRMINPEGQIAILKRPDGKIEKFSVDLYGNRARYLRLHWQDAMQVPKLKSVSLDSVQQTEVFTPLQWSGPIQPATCAENYCDYPLPANTPLDSLRINLSEPNTLASVTVFAHVPAQIARDYRRHHHPLYVLRHKRQSPVEPSTSTTEVILAQAVAYRLKQGGVELRSDDLALDGGIYTRLRIQTQGPINLLGQTAPSIEVASTPRSLLFLGRGSAPFSVHWGVDEKQGEALPFATLVPDYRATKPLKADVATVDIPAQILRQAPPSEAKATNLQQEKSTPEKKLWLWAALTAGLLLLASMAWSLFKSMAKQKQEENRPAA